MKNSVPYVRFHGEKGQIHMSGLRSLAFPLLLALLIVILCGCGGRKAKDNVSSDRQAPEVADAEPTGEQSPGGGTPAGEQMPGDVNPAGEPIAGDVNPAGEPGEENTEPAVWETPEGGEPSASDRLTITINGLSNTIDGFSSIINAVNGQMQSFDKKLTEILNQDRSGLSTPVFIVSILLVVALNAALTAFVVHSFSRKFREVKQKLDALEKQVEQAGQWKQELQEAISDADSQETLDALTEAINQYTNTMTAYMQGTPKAQKSQSATAAQTAPKKEFYQVTIPRSNSDKTILQKSETNQPVVGWISSSSPGRLILEPALDSDGKCSRDTLYSSQTAACFTVQPPDPVDSASVYAVDISKRAWATSNADGQYVLSEKGQLTARR